MKITTTATILALALALPAVASRPAAADPIADPKPWLQNLEQLARANNFSAMVKAVDDVAAPAFEKALMPGLMEEFTKYFAGKTPRELEPLPEHDTGTVLQRSYFAVVYDDDILFYSVAFMRTGKGWVLFGFSLQTNVDKVATQAWPL